MAILHFTTSCRPMMADSLCSFKSFGVMLSASHALPSRTANLKECVRSFLDRFILFNIGVTRYI